MSDETKPYQKATHAKVALDIFQIKVEDVNFGNPNKAQVLAELTGLAQGSNVAADAFLTELATWQSAQKFKPSSK